jgi:putative endonuclease
MNIKKTRGDIGEAKTCDYIKEKGFQIVETNYLKAFGEIDIVALHKDEIVFIEVKTRKFDSLTDGGDAVTVSKRRKLVKTAYAFIDENPQYGNMNARFDVAEVTVTTDDVPQLIALEYYEDAFNATFV